VRHTEPSTEVDRGELDAQRLLDVLGGGGRPTRVRNDLVWIEDLTGRVDMDADDLGRPVVPGLGDAIELLLVDSELRRAAICSWSGPADPPPATERPAEVLMRSATRAGTPTSREMCAILDSSLVDSTFRAKTPEMIASSSSWSVFPGPAKTMSRGSKPTSFARKSSPPDAISAPAPSVRRNPIRASEGLAFIE
jgi:hypothetical protein